MRNHTFARRGAVSLEQGFSLVELMIAVVLALLLLAGLIQVFTGSKQAYRVSDSTGRMQENTRFAMEALGRDIRHADFWGGTKSASIVLAGGLTASTTPCSLGWHADPSTPVFGWDGTSVPTSGLGLCIVANYVAGSDVLALHFADPTTAAAVESATAPVPPVSNAADLVLKSRVGRNGVIFQRSAYPAAAASVEGTAQEGVYMYAVRSVVFSLGTASETTPPDCSVVPRPVTCTQSILYVCDSALGCGTTSGPQRLVEGVEQMQFVYGRDTNDDSVADLYQTATEVQAASAWPQVISIRVGLMMRGDQLDAFQDTLTYTLPGNYSFTAQPAQSQFMRRPIVREFQIRNRIRS